VAVFHAAYVAFVTIGFALIAAGIVMRWEWVRAFWFRVAHVGAIAFVCAESLMGTACPLTTLEGQLRAMSGEASHSRDFVGYWVDRLIYYDFPPWVFMVAYAVFGIWWRTSSSWRPRDGPAINGRFGKRRIAATFERLRVFSALNTVLAFNIVAREVGSVRLLKEERHHVISRSKWANESRTLSVSRPIEGVVLNCWVTATNDTPHGSIPNRRAASRRLIPSTNTARRTCPYSSTPFIPPPPAPCGQKACAARFLLRRNQSIRPLQ